MPTLDKVFPDSMDRTIARSLLRQARDRLEFGHASFVCTALDASGGHRLMRERLQREICARIWPRVTVIEWLGEQWVGASDTPAQYRAYRLHWIDSLIKELQ